MNGFEELHNDEEEEGTVDTSTETGSEVESPRGGASTEEGAENDGTEGAGTEGAENNSGDVEESEGVDATEDSEGSGDVVAPGIEQFLAQYNIIGGMIKQPGVDGGEPTLTHYNDLDPDVQFKVLTALTSAGSTQNNDLSEDESKVLAWARDTGKPITEAIEELAQTRANEILTLQSSSDEAYETMSKDAITTKWLRESNPEATEADIMEELENIKGGKFYDKNVEALRSQFIEKRSNAEAKAIAEANAETERKLEEDRGIIAQAAMDIDYIAKWPIKDETKNEILADLLEVNEYGDSKFVQEVFSDPKKLFEAAWLVKKGPEMFDQMERYYKREMANKFQEGKNSALNGLSPNPINSSSTGRVIEDQDQDIHGRKEEIKSLDSLHED
jgi:hypothetical protein